MSTSDTEYQGECSTVSKVLSNQPVLSEFKPYVKTGIQLMRKYELGENLAHISVATGDLPEVGGMIAVNPKNTRDMWYVAKEFFEDNYEPAGIISKHDEH